MAKKFSIHDWQAKQRLTEQDDFQKRQDRLTPGKNPDAFYGDGQLDKLRGLGNGSDQDLLTTLRNQIEQGVLDSKMKDQFVNLLTKLIDRGISEIEVTGMEPDTGNMEKEFKVIGPANQSDPLTDVSIEYNGQTYILNFEYGDIIDDHGNEGKDLWFEAEAEDGNIFRVDVYASNYDNTGEVDEIFWNTLEVEPPKDSDNDLKLEPELDEQNTVAANTGFSMQTGNSEVYATKNAFGKKRNKRN